MTKSMNKAKRKKLEAHGWKIGNTSDFLNLSPEELVKVNAQQVKSTQKKAIENNRCR